MVATLQPFPVFRAYDANGAPLSGGKLFSYAAGTNTPLATYTDQTATANNPNPVVLDITGSANVWYGANLYKLVLQDASGVVQWTVDNVGILPGDASNTTGGYGAATDIPSAALVDLGTLASHFGNITGSTTISAFGSTATLANPLYLIKFTAALTLTSSVNLILPGAMNITTAASDHAWVEYLGGGAWRVFLYMRADGSSIVTTALPVANGGTGQTTVAAVQANFGIFQHSQAFATTGTFTPATGVTNIFIRMWGGGGGGGNATTTSCHGAGGGGGGYSEGFVNVTPGTAYTVTVGTGGAATANGVASSFVGDAITLTANGGNAGTTATTNNSAILGGGGGNATGGVFNMTGGHGETAIANATTGTYRGGWGGGGAGGGGAGGNDAAAVFATTYNGTAGIVPGGGGSGGYRQAADATGGAGGAGLVVIYYP